VDTTTVGCPECGARLAVLKPSVDGKRGSAWCSDCGRAVRALRKGEAWEGVA